MLRHLFVAMSAVVLAVAPATAQLSSNSSELDMPLTRVSELVQPLPSTQPESEATETEEQFPNVSTLEEQVSVTPVQPTVQPITVQPTLEVVNPGACKECSQTEESKPLVEAMNQDIPKPDQPYNLPPPTTEPSRVLETETVTPPPAQNTPTKSDTQERVVPTVQFSQFSLEPSRVTNYSFAANTIVPFEPSRTNDKPANNIVRFNAKGRLNQVEPIHVVETREESFVVTPNVTYDVSLESGNSSTPTLEPETAFSLSRETKTTHQTGVVTTLETSESLSRSFGTSYPKATPQTVFSLDREFSIPVLETPTARTQKQNVVIGNDTRNVRVSNRAIDLGGAVEVQANLQPVVVETQQEVKPKPRPTGSVSVGVSGIGGEEPVLETAVGIEYNGFSSTLSFNHPLNGTGQDTIGISTTLPISERSSFTVKADQINIDPIISATVESRISEQFTGSVSFNSINRPEFNVELAGSYQISQHWTTNASLNLTTRQLNIGATYTGKGFDATVKVDNIAENPQLGATLGIELSASTKLELSGSNLTTDPTLGVKAIFSF